MAPAALEDSMPDLYTPVKVKMGLDPIGTPRRTASAASSVSGLNAFSCVKSPGASHQWNGLDVSGRPSRFFTNSTPTLTSNGVNGNDQVARFWKRYNDLKEVDDQKDNLLEEVLAHYALLQQTHTDYVKAAHRDYHQPGSIERNAYYQHSLHTTEMLDRAAYMVVLIDGDGILFSHYLLRQGESGGRQAASLLRASVNHWARSSLQDCPENIKITTRVYADFRGLAETCQRTGIVSSAEMVDDFVRGFTGTDALFNFIDVGPGRDRVAIKMKAEFELHCHNFTCRHIVFGCSRDSDFALFLRKFVNDNDVISRTTLLEGNSLEKELLALPFQRTKFGKIFCESKSNLTSPYLLMDMPRGRQDSKGTLSNFNPSSGIFTPAIRTQAAEAPLFGPRAAPGFASPAHFTRGELTRTNSLASSTAVSDTPAPINGSAVAASSGWATIARSSAHLPYKDLTRPPPVETKITGPVVQKNKLGQRIDQPMEYDHDRVYELKKQKYCNQHYIGKGCCHHEAGNGACPHRHEPPLNKDEKKWLRVVARETVCKKGTSCEEFGCIYGHHCPYPKMTEGSMKGVGCINGENCRFAREMHGMDTTVATTLRSDEPL